jgi:hypothetical protein
MAVGILINFNKEKEKKAFGGIKGARIAIF